MLGSLARGATDALGQFGVSKAALPHVLELAGLGTLAVPAAYHMMAGEKPVDRAMSGAELGGLGILATPSIMHLLGH